MKKDTVDIHGKQYETVASRVQRFRTDQGSALALITEIIDRTDTDVVMKASIVDMEGRTLATGHAEEQRSASQINRTSALENCETSAIGRALAAFGMAGTEFASADEVAAAIGQQNAPKPTRPAVGTAKTETRKLVNLAQTKLLLARSRDASGLDDRQEIYDFFLEEFGRMPNEIYADEVDGILKKLSGGES